MESGILITKAMELCVSGHAGQWRDGDTPLPYASHPFDVVHRLRYEGRVDDEVVLCAGYLHDLLEETAVTEEQIESIFGQEVKDLVLEVTRDEPTEEQTEGLSSQEIYDLRNQMLMDEIKEMSPEAMTIKLADRVSNVNAAKVTRSGKRLEKYVRQSRQMLEIIPKSTNERLWKRLDKLVSKLEENN